MSKPKSTNVAGLILGSDWNKGWPLPSLSLFMHLSDFSNQFIMEMGEEVWLGQSEQLLTFQLEQHMVGMALEQT